VCNSPLRLEHLNTTQLALAGSEADGLWRDAVDVLSWLGTDPCRLTVLGCDALLACCVPKSGELGAFGSRWRAHGIFAISDYKSVLGGRSMSSQL
jgi:hypothetical protein